MVIKTKKNKSANLIMNKIFSSLVVRVCYIMWKRRSNDINVVNNFEVSLASDYFSRMLYSTKQSFFILKITCINQKMTNEQWYVILVSVIVVFDVTRLQNLLKFQQMFCLNKYSRFIIELQNKKLSRMTIVEVD